MPHTVRAEPKIKGLKVFASCNSYEIFYRYTLHFSGSKNKVDKENEWEKAKLFFSRL